MRVKTKKDSLLYKFLTIKVYRTKSMAKADKSRFNYGTDDKGYYLRILGVLSGLFGLQVQVDGGTRENLLTPEEQQSPYYDYCQTFYTPKEKTDEN